MLAFRRVVAAFVISACMPAYAGSTRVSVERGGYTGPLEIRVGVPHEDGEPKWLVARRLATESVADVGALAAGTYVVLVSGAAPFERIAISAGVRGEGDEVLPVTLPKPRRLKGTIRVGTGNAGEAVLNFEHRQFGWSTTFTAGPDGTFDATLWQDGPFLLSVRGGTLASPVRRPVRIEGETLAVDLSPLRITGVVSDTDGIPVADATVGLRNEFGRDIATLRLQTDRHGMFDFADVKMGPYAISVSADGYLLDDDHHVYVTGETPVERVGITLSSGLLRPLRIVDAAGKPVAASVNVISDGKLRSRTATDVEGRATVSIPPAGSSAAWILPRTGSFAVVRLDAGRSEAEPQRVVVPDGSVSVVIEILKPDRSGIADLALLMRYNGELLLPSASAAFGLRTDEKGQARLTRVPPGLYEFWPFASVDEAAALVASQSFSPVPAPITVEARSGESRATVMVEKKVSKPGVVQ